MQGIDAANAAWRLARSQGGVFYGRCMHFVEDCLRWLPGLTYRIQGLRRGFGTRCKKKFAAACFAGLSCAFCVLPLTSGSNVVELNKETECLTWRGVCMDSTGVFDACLVMGVSAGTAHGMRKDCRSECTWDLTGASSVLRYQC